MTPLLLKITFTTKRKFIDKYLIYSYIYLNYVFNCNRQPIIQIHCLWLYTGLLVMPKSNRGVSRCNDGHKTFIITMTWFSLTFSHHRSFHYGMWSCFDQSMEHIIGGHTTKLNDKSMTKVHQNHQNLITDHHSILQIVLLSALSPLAGRQRVKTVQTIPKDYLWVIWSNLEKCTERPVKQKLSVCTW